MRVVASITTIPGRYGKLIQTLKSLRAQDYPLDAIYLTIPKESHRLKQPYPELPVEIRQLCSVGSVDIDYGPCTKILGGLVNEAGPNTVIFTFDDDVVYAPNLVSTMLNYHKQYPNSALGSSGILLKYGFPFYSTVSNCRGNWNNLTGFDVGTEGRAVDALCGFSAVLYVRKFFPSNELLYNTLMKYPLMDSNVYFNDDIMISAFLSKHNIERRVVPNIPMGNLSNALQNELDGNEISYDKLAFIQRFRRSINKVREWGFFSETQAVAMDETIGGHVIIVTIFLLLLLLVVLLFWLR